jgi:hypothetical protein
MLLASATIPIWKHLPIITMVITSVDNKTVNPEMTTDFFRKLNLATMYEALADGTTALKDIRYAKLHCTMHAIE